jgi:prepilin-type processing-associated H-X9-DG protein
MQNSHGGEFSGIFTITKSRRVAHILDGTSNVVACAEANSTGFKWGAIRTAGTGTRRLNSGERVFRAAFVFTGRYGECCEPGRGLFEFTDPAGGKTWWFPDVASHAFSPTYIASYGPNTEWPGASSVHPGGLNVLLADGSARFVADTIPWHIWLKVNAIRDGNPVLAF